MIVIQVFDDCIKKQNKKTNLNNSMLKKSEHCDRADLNTDSMKNMKDFNTQREVQAYMCITCSEQKPCTFSGEKKEKDPKALIATLCGRDLPARI